MNPFKPTPHKTYTERMLFAKYSKFILGDTEITPFVIENYKRDLLIFKQTQS